MHLRNLLARLLRNRPRVATLARVLPALRRGGHVLLLLLLLLLMFLHVVIVTTVDVLNVHNILVFFVLSVIFVAEHVVVIARVDTHHSTATACFNHFLVHGGLFEVGARLLAARGQRALIISLGIVSSVPLLFFHFFHVGCNVFGDVGRRDGGPFLTSRVPVG